VGSTSACSLRFELCRVDLLAFMPKQRGINFHCLQHSRVVRAEIFLADIQHSLVKRFGRLIISLAIVENREIVQAGSNLKIIEPCSYFPSER
jgi:hypothetical protein